MQSQSTTPPYGRKMRHLACIIGHAYYWGIQYMYTISRVYVSVYASICVITSPALIGYIDTYVLDATVQRT